MVTGEVELPEGTALESAIVPKVVGRLMELGCYYEDLQGVMGRELINDLVTLSMPAIDAVSVTQTS